MTTNLLSEASNELTPIVLCGTMNACTAALKKDYEIYSCEVIHESGLHYSVESQVVWSTELNFIKFLS